MLLLLPQRYEFSSKSQRADKGEETNGGCCCYHKGTNFQANHNGGWCACPSLPVVVATTKVRIFKQITTNRDGSKLNESCCCYHKGTNFQANHNWITKINVPFVGCCCYHKGTNFQANHNCNGKSAHQSGVVVATTKVRIFKQITTYSVLYLVWLGCCCYHKGTNFQANHNINCFHNFTI